MTHVRPPRYRWQPTTAEIARIAGIPVELVIRFDHNTSPFPTDWAVPLVEVPAGHLNEYPGADYRGIREAAAAVSDVPADHVAVGAGIDELVLLAGRAFLRPGTRAAAATPTYPLYRIATAQAGAEFVAVRRSPPSFEFPADEVIDSARTADLVWLCEPNNPTGDRSPDGVIEAVIAASDGLVVIDAAYAEFAGDRWGGVASRHHNVLVLHTLSKAYGLAGARVGYAIGHPDLIDALDAVRPPGSIASLSVELAIAALNGRERVATAVGAIGRERADLAERLLGLGLRPLPSLTNFVLCEVGDAAERIAAAAISEGLVLRSFPGDDLAGHLRFTVRTRPEHDRLIEFLERNRP